MPFFQHIPGKSFWLKFLMYVYNTFRGHIKLHKHFRWTVWRSNIDIMIDADDLFYCIAFFAVWIFCMKKFSVKVFDVCLEHI